MCKIRNLYIGTAGAAFFALASSAAMAHVCDSSRNAAYDAYDAYINYNKGAGYIRDNQDSINKTRREIGNEAFDKCKDDPAYQALQGATDLSVAWATNGLSIILGTGNKAFHIDIGEILDGNFAGGRDSFINKGIDDVNRALGIGENHFLRKPFG